MNRQERQRQMVRIACVQHACEDSIDRNVERALELVREAVRRDADIVCLQELFATKYFAGQNIKKDAAIERFSETLSGPIIKTLKKTARDARIVLIGGSFYEEGTGELQGMHFNSSPIIDTNGELIAIHRKAHIPDDPGYFERNFFDMGDQRVTVAETQKGKIAVGICFDQWFPEVAREAGDQGASALFFPTAIGHTNDEVSGYIPGDSGMWDRKLHHVLAGQAANNHLFLGIANRIGVEDDTRFFGQSAIYDHNGDVHSRLGSRREGVSLMECDFSIVPKLRDAWGFHKARRTDLPS